MRLGVSCVISLDNFGPPPPQPLSILSSRRHASQGLRNTCLVLDLPGRFVCGLLYRRSALYRARPSSYIVLVQRASHCQTSRSDSEGLDEVLLHSPRSPTKSLVCDLSHFTCILRKRLVTVCRSRSRPERGRIKEAVGCRHKRSAIGKAPTSISPQCHERRTADENTTRHTSVLVD